MENKYGMLFASDIKNNITQLIREGASFKKEVFRSALMGEELNYRASRIYMGSINDFLRYWDEFSKDLNIKMKKAKGVEGVNTVEYDFVKKYVYAKYDYASILQFADGLIRGIKEEKFVHTEDIDDFFDSTVDKAFPDIPNNVAGVLDSVVNADIGVDFNHRTTKIDAKMYDSLKSYNMFDTRTRTELYKAIDKTIEFITYDLKEGRYPKSQDMKLFVSMVTKIVEYAIYSLTAYACRIYLIQAYAYPFIFSTNKEYRNEYTESVENNTENNKEEKKEKNNDNNEKKYTGPSVKDMDISNRKEIECTVMRDTDDTLTKDPVNINKYFNKFMEFIKLIGAESLYTDGRINTYPNYWFGPKVTTSNKFISKLLENPLYNTLSGTGVSVYFNTNDPTSYRDLEEFAHNLKTFTHNAIQGIQGTSTPKQEILYVIRETKVENDIKKNQELAKDLYDFALYTLCNIENRIKTFSKYGSTNDGFNNNTITSRNISIDVLNILSELYRDISFAILQRARDIEANINKLRNASIEKAISNTSIKIPDLNKNDHSSNNNMMASVPDTTRVPIDLLDVYEVPLLETMEIRDMFIRMDPRFKNDRYYSEAEGTSSNFNSLSSKIKSLWQRIEMFFMNQQYKNAVSWIKEHEEELMNMDLTGCSIEMYPYKADISLPKGFSNLSENMRKAPDGAFTDKTALANWAKSLYPNDTVYKWFNPGDGQQIDGARMWRNAFLFQYLDGPNNESTVKDEEVKAVKSDAKTIAENLSYWIDNIKTSNETYQALRKMNSDIAQSMKELQRKVVEKTKTENVNEATDTTTEEDKTNNTSQQSSDKTPVTAANAEGNDPKNNNQQGSSSNAVIKQAELAINRLYIPLGLMIIDCIKNQYSYIQAVYNYAKKNAKSE